ncbi:TPM domain-containing protein [Herbaspirillum sp. ST 5-3]|uniref:TPM domain-containing protein n=1 Tax=Oxalobacteraceae TaxID=75682 RepID=UPI0010A45024|nr:TPM domain-containing protein [Herbaspirillum sp. ST 5-3]
MSFITRLFHHVAASYWQLRRQFPERSLAAIKSTIEEAESRHGGEIRFAVEAALQPAQILRGMTARERALEVFSLLRVWDTEHNNGVLIYVLLGDRAVEIIADRGIHGRSGAWESIAHAMQDAFGRGNFESGSINGVRAVAHELITHYPVEGPKPDELPNDVELL